MSAPTEVVKLAPPSEERLTTYAVRDDALHGGETGLVGEWTVHHSDLPAMDWPDALFSARVLAVVAQQTALLNAGISRESVELFGAIEMKRWEAEQLNTTVQLNRTAAPLEVPC